MSAHDFHCTMGHLGVDPDCIICKETKGTMRYTRHTVDPHRETRPAYSFALDMLVFLERDRGGFRYVLVESEVLSHSSIPTDTDLPQVRC